MPTIASLRLALCALPIALLAACSGGSDNTDGALLDLNNLPTQPASIQLKLSCPKSISPGTTLRSLTATFTNQDKQPIPDAFINLSATTGTISAPPGVPNSGGATTDDFGIVEFDYAISDAVPLDSVVTIKAEANYQGAKVTRSCALMVKNSNFEITQPLDDSSLIVGTANAVPVQLQWTDDKGNGVAGSVRLTAGTGGILITPSLTASKVTVATNAAGELDGTTSFACTKRGLVTLKAEQLGGTGGASSLVTVNCIESPLYLDVQVSADEVNAAPDNRRFADFTIKPVAKDNSQIKDLPLTAELVTPAGGGDRLLATAISTNDNGVATTRYEAGTVSGTAEVRFCVKGGAICTSRLVKVKASASATGKVSLTLACPASVNVGATSGVGTATLADSNGKGIADTNIGFSTTQGPVNAPPDQAASYQGNTGSDGKLLFTYTAPDNIKSDTAVGITGRTNIGGTNYTGSCSILAKADIFQLTAPTDNTEQSLGTAAASPVSLLWQNGDRAGVAGQVVISASNNAKLTSDLSQTGAQQITLNTTSSGNLDRSLYFICTQPGPVEIRAVDQKTFNKLSSVTVQCVDPPASMTARVTPQTLDRNPANNRFADATFTLLGQSGSNVRNADLTFTLISRAGGGDRLLNSSAVTDEGGSAIARYESGTTTGTTIIEGCYRSSSICERVTITVQ